MFQENLKTLISVKIKKSISAPPRPTNRVLRLHLRRKSAESASADSKLCFLSTSGLWGES